MTTHEHECGSCGVVWICTDEEWKDGPFEACGLTKSAKINGQGPYCHACRTGIEFIRYARHSHRNPARLLKMLLKAETPPA